MQPSISPYGVILGEENGKVGVGDGEMDTVQLIPLSFSGLLWKSSPADPPPPFYY
jgi:hypothetical protein